MHLQRHIGGVLIQLQNGIEKPVIFVSHILSDQATRWGMMELELYAVRILYQATWSQVA